MSSLSRLPLIASGPWLKSTNDGGIGGSVCPGWSLCFTLGSLIDMEWGGLYSIKGHE